jgi:hypothetical protein
MKQILSITNADSALGQMLINELKKDYYIIALTENGEVKYADEIVVDWTISLLTLKSIIKSHYVINLGIHFTEYKNIQSLNKELNGVNWLIKGLSNSFVQKIINISYKGGYISSDNLYLQARGLIEKRFSETKISTLQLNTQYILNTPANPTKDDSYFLAQKNKVEIIGNGSQIVYAIGCYDLVKTIAVGLKNPLFGSYDVFSDVMELETMVKIINNYKQYTISKLPSFIAYIKAYVNEYYSPTQIDLFSRPLIMMYNARVKKDFNLEFQSIFNEVSVENIIAHTKYHVRLTIKRLVKKQHTVSLP